MIFSCSSSFNATLTTWWDSPKIWVCSRRLGSDSQNPGVLAAMLAMIFAFRFSTRLLMSGPFPDFRIQYSMTAGKMQDKKQMLWSNFD